MRGRTGGRYNPFPSCFNVLMIKPEIVPISGHERLNLDTLFDISNT
jgi:hypothetical protein